MYWREVVEIPYSVHSLSKITVIPSAPDVFNSTVDEISWKKRIYISIKKCPPKLA